MTESKPKKQGLPPIQIHQIAIVAVLSGSAVILCAVFSKYPGLIELHCTIEGCHVVIDGRTQDEP